MEVAAAATQKAVSSGLNIKSVLNLVALGQKQVSFGIQILNSSLLNMDQSDKKLIETT